MADYIIKDKEGKVLQTLVNPTQEDINQALAPFWQKGLKQDDLVCGFVEDKPVDGVKSVKVRKPRSDKGAKRTQPTTGKRVRSRAPYFLCSGVIRLATKEEVVAEIRKRSGENLAVIQGRELKLKVQYKLTGL